MPLFDADEIVESQKQDVENTIPFNILAKIEEVFSPTPEQSTKIEALLSPIFKDGDLDSIKSQAQEMLDELEEKLKIYTEVELRRQDAREKLNEQAQVAGARVEQDAETSQKYIEPEAQETKFSSPTNIPDADSSLAENYPNTIGWVTETSDFIKLNKETGTIQIVHHSGTQIKVDNTGNVTIHTVGNLKQVVEGDMLLQVAGGLDITSGKGIYMHAPEIETKADQKVTLDAMQVELPTTVDLKADKALCQVMTLKAATLMSAPAISLG